MLVPSVYVSSKTVSRKVTSIYRIYVHSAAIAFEWISVCQFHAIKRTRCALDAIVESFDDFRLTDQGGRNPILFMFVSGRAYQFYPQ